jgi:hypothetical protein
MKEDGIWGKPPDSFRHTNHPEEEAIPFSLEL